MKSEIMSQHGFSNDYCIEINASRRKCYYMKHIYCGSGYLSTDDATTWNNASETECMLAYASVQMPEISKL